MNWWDQRHPWLWIICSSTWIICSLVWYIEASAAAAKYKLWEATSPNSLQWFWFLLWGFLLVNFLYSLFYWSYQVYSMQHILSTNEKPSMLQRIEGCRHPTQGCHSLPLATSGVGHVACTFLPCFRYFKLKKTVKYELRKE